MTQAEQYTKLAEAIRDFRTYDIARQMYIDAFYYWKDLNVECELRGGTISISGVGLQVQSTLPWRQVSYDTIISQPNVELSYGNQVSIGYKQVKTLPNGVVITCQMSTAADIPEEDLETLELLGKVTTELVPASIERSVYCPN